VTLRDAGIGVVLLDIEGTTTPIAFVHDVLFPYARARLRGHLESAPAAEVDDTMAALAAEHARDAARGESPPAWQSGTPRERLESALAYLHWLMDRDRKSTALKALQGQIWEGGYAAGVLKGEVYSDVPAALARWTAAGRRVAIFSSGSVLAQKRLFANSTAGDLTPFLSSYFDTAVGTKIEADSYRRIADQLGVPADRVIFLSDVARELDAARAAGMKTIMVVRPPATLPDSADHRVIRSFNEIA
jgi:enolase-phosphatase E1